jgi:hypothetical protein
MRISFASIFMVCCLSLPMLAQRTSLSTLLPGDTSGWRLTEAPRSFVGNELFNMIDGGAALYQEFGFDRAISGKYEDSARRAVDAEIYAMSDSAAAYGIFGITAAAGEQRLELGDDGELGEYFLVFRKGRHLVTVSGQTTDKPTMDGVKLIGRAIEAGIDSGSRTPEFVQRFTPLLAKGSRPVYLRGAIGAGNFYVFAPQNVFSVHEGVTGERDSTRFFVFRYPSADESAKNFRAAVEALRVNSKYSNVELTSHRFKASDRDGNLLRASSVGNAILVIIGRDAGMNQKLEAAAREALSRP